MVTTYILLSSVSYATTIGCPSAFLNWFLLSLHMVLILLKLLFKKEMKRADFCIFGYLVTALNKLTLTNIIDLHNPASFVMLLNLSTSSNLFRISPCL